MTAEKTIGGSGQASLANGMEGCQRGRVAEVKEAEEIEERLLKALRLRVVADQGLEDGQDVPPVFHHALEHIAEAGLALHLAVPAGQHGGRHFDVAAQLLSRVAPQEQPVKKGRLALRELQLVLAFSRDWLNGQHQCKKAQFTQIVYGVKGYGGTLGTGGY